jgi:signal transduction histidine kinase
LFDTPPSRQEIRLGLVVVGLLFAATLVILPFGNVHVGEVYSFVPANDAFLLASDFIIATLLYAQGSLFRSRALMILASTYVFTGVLLIPHALTFPGAFAPNGLLGAETSTTGWLAAFRRLAFPAAVILYALFRRADSEEQAKLERAFTGVAAWVFAAVAFAALVTIVAINGDEVLPSLFINRREVNYPHLLFLNSATLALTIGAIAMLSRERKSVLDIWLLVSLAAWAMQTVLNMPLLARFTIGAYAMGLSMLASSLIVMIALLAESNRLYARLALATAARNRELEARLMSVDAVAAAIAHEVGQPLTAIALNASVGKRWLTHSEPNVEKAIESLHAIDNSGRRSFDIIKSIRSTAAAASVKATELSINDLVRETLGLLDRELAGAKASLQLSLDEELPPIVANHAQIQQVIASLITSAIESLASTRGRRRRIEIRSKTLEGQKVLLEVSHSGTAPSDVWRVFEAFPTTEMDGSGIGLSLCRTIIEEHGGRIWASAAEKHGSTFHVQLPRNRSPVQAHAAAQ